MKSNHENLQSGIKPIRGISRLNMAKLTAYNTEFDWQLTQALMDSVLDGELGPLRIWVRVEVALPAARWWFCVVVDLKHIHIWDQDFWILVVALSNPVYASEAIMQDEETRTLPNR